MDQGKRSTLLGRLGGGGGKQGRFFAGSGAPRMVLPVLRCCPVVVLFATFVLLVIFTSLFFGKYQVRTSGAGGTSEMYLLSHGCV